MVKKITHNHNHVHNHNHLHTDHHHEASTPSAETVSPNQEANQVGFQSHNQVRGVRGATNQLLSSMAEKKDGLVRDLQQSAATLGERIKNIAQQAAEWLEDLSPVQAGDKQIKSGARGKEVIALQNLLNLAGSKPRLKADGKFGNKTKLAVMNFQRNNGLKADGVVGQKTFAKLLDHDNPVSQQENKETTKTSEPQPTQVEENKTPEQPTEPTSTTAEKKEPSTIDQPTEVDHIRGNEGTTPFAQKSANSLTDEEAMQELKALQEQGVGDFIFHRSGPYKDRVQLKFPMDGVKFKKAAYRNTDKFDKKSWPLNPRMAVATVRTAQWAKQQGIETIHHAGFIGNNPKNRHGVGRAFDIAGFEGTNPKTGEHFHYDILKDWGRAPKAEGQVGYRLDPNTHMGAIFQDAYRFFTTQFRDSNEGPSKMGDRSYILTPDHPSPKIARGHADHFHIEVSDKPGEQSSFNEAEHNHNHAHHHHHHD